jgi:hypothetical protein
MELLMQIKEFAEDRDFEVLHGIVDCLWVIGDPIASFKGETGILTEITFLPISDGSGAYNRYFGRLKHRQNEDPRLDGKEGRYAGACMPDATGSIRGFI